MKTYIRRQQNIHTAPTEQKYFKHQDTKQTTTEVSTWNDQ